LREVWDTVREQRQLEPSTPKKRRKGETNHVGASEDSSDLDLASGENVHRRSDETTELELGDTSEVVDHQDDLILAVVSKRNEASVLVGRAEGEWIIKEAGSARCSRVDKVQMKEKTGWLGSHVD
jgi:hypothetical protein